MQGSQKSKIRSDEDVKPTVFDLEVVEPSFLSHEEAVEQIVTQVEKIVAEFGDPERAADFDSRQFVYHWIDSYVPALGDKPSKLLGTAEGRAHVRRVLNSTWSGAYA